MFGRRGDTYPWDEDASELLDRFAERRERRGRLRLGEDPQDLDWDSEDDGRLTLPVREGHVIALPSRGLWALFMQWRADYGHAFLVRGSRSEVELDARRIQRNGPSSGPEFSSSAAAWYRFDDDTEHMSIEAGELRLMHPTDLDDGVLILARSGEPDSVAVLGVDEYEALRESAEARGRRGGRRLYISIGGRRRYLQALGADGLVAYLELGDDVLVLGHLGDGEFLLAWQTGDVQRGLARYTLAEVMRGDLGPVFDQGRRQSGSAASSTRTAPPRRASPEKIPPSSMARPWRPRLAGDALKAAHKHLTPCKEWEGEASTVVPRILGAIARLVHLDLDNVTLWAKNFLPFLADRSGEQIHCCRKILYAALHIIARRTRLLVRRGRRWVIRFGDLRARGSKLLQWMARRGPLDSDPTPRGPAEQGAHGEPAQATAAPGTEAATAATTAPVDDGSPPTADATTPTATEPDRGASASPPAADATPAAPETTTSSSTTDKTPSAGDQPTPSPSVPPADRPSPAASSAPRSHAAAASGYPSAPPKGNGMRLPRRLSGLMRLFVAMALHGDPGALAAGFPPSLNSPDELEAMFMAAMHADLGRSGRGRGVTSRGRSSGIDDDELFPSGPLAPQGPPGKRRTRPP